MPPPKNPSGLGRAILNKKAKDNRRAQETGFYTTDASSDRLKSITQERDLDEFLNTATLAGTDFTAERRNVKIVSNPANSGSQHNPFLLSAEEEEKTLEKFKENKQRLRVPRRSPWTKSMTPAELDRQERNAFLEWRRGLADLQDKDQFLLTPFERNIEVWRQLWRVIERSHLVVQIVDGRNPLRFRCEDLESYVKDVVGPEGEKDSGNRGIRENLLLINKSDLLTAKQRRIWADYFDSLGVRYAFFSAANAAALQEARREALAAEQNIGVVGESDNEEDPLESSSEESEEESEDEAPGAQEQALDEQAQQVAEEQQSDSDDPSEDHEDFLAAAEEDSEDARDPRTQVLSVLELEDLFARSAPDLSKFTNASGAHPTSVVVGLVGYPNVGKSSTINALLGEKKVSVSSTPGKTKHFQTIPLSPSMTLCDCPGLVFPQFATTRADLVCDGVLPIDQLREYTAPAVLVVRRIPTEVLEATYGITLSIRGLDEGGDGKARGEDLLIPFAVARGFTRSGQGNPDEARAARFILKDYVTAKLLYCHPPPGVSPDEFNEQSRKLAIERAAGKKRAPTTRVSKNADTFVPSVAHADSPGGVGGYKSSTMDKDFFDSGGMASRAFVKGTARDGMEFSRSRLYPHQNTVANDGSAMTGRRARVAAVLASAGADGGSDKKHHKKPKRAKQRSGKGYD